MALNWKEAAYKYLWRIVLASVLKLCTEFYVNFTEKKDNKQFNLSVIYFYLLRMSAQCSTQNTGQKKSGKESSSETIQFQQTV